MTTTQPRQLERFRLRLLDVFDQRQDSLQRFRFGVQIIRRQLHRQQHVMLLNPGFLRGGLIGHALDNEPNSFFQTQLLPQRFAGIDAVQSDPILPRVGLSGAGIGVHEQTTSSVDTRIREEDLNGVAGLIVVDAQVRGQFVLQFSLYFKSSNSAPFESN